MSIHVYTSGSDIYVYVYMYICENIFILYTRVLIHKYTYTHIYIYIHTKLNRYVQINKILAVLTNKNIRITEYKFIFN